ncbi:MAG: hypothetical protein JWR19_2010 [Pedosphaera sp.]|nr:hypothetical protein [Pedosphaera sp.]
MLLVWWLVLGAIYPADGASANLKFQIVPQFNGASLAFDSLTNATTAGQRISVTRLDFLLSNIALHRPDGTWVAQTNWFAYVSAREGKTRFELNNIPTGNYDRVRFLIGLTPEINHKDAAEFPATHPLNPDVNGLHWGWTGGYVFLALEGNWQQPDGKQSGYSYHLATDRQLMTVELPVLLNLSSNQEVRLALNVDQIFARPARFVLNDATTSTHSRTNDAIANQLRAGIEHAFALAQVQPAAVASLPSTATNHLDVASNATPYRLTISHFFPRPALPTDNPLTEQGVELGRQLFFNPQLSINHSQSCAACHKPTAAFTDSRSVSTGAEGQSGTRNAMPLFNLAWKSSYFWDGRAATLREQVLLPIQNPIEMHTSLTNVVARLNLSTNYPALFAHAFSSPEITPDRIARALEQFLLTQVSHNSKFDRVLNGQARFSNDEQRGFELFHTEYDPHREQFGADCFHCHGGPLFQSQSFANNGLDSDFTDAGRSVVTGQEGDRGKFAVPSLRNVEVTAPYMHDGRFKTLDEAVEHYCTGTKRSATLDPNLAKHPDGGVPLSDADKRALIAFLKTLTDERFHPQTNTPALAELN